MNQSANQTKRKYHTTLEYNPLTIVPCTGYLAIYLDECEDESGQCELTAEPLDAIGIAEVTEKRWQIVNGDARLVSENKYPNQPVGYHLDDSGFHIADEATNLMGMCRVGEDISTHAVNLSSSDRKRLRVKT